MRTVLFLLLFFLLLGYLSSCYNENKESILTKMVNRDVPKFIGILPTLSHNDMKLAFQQANSILKYKVRKPSSSNFSFEACSEAEDGKSWMDGQITLSAYKLTENSFAISLFFYPPLKDSILFYNVKRLMNNYKKIDDDGASVWKINDWLLRITGLDDVSYFPVTDASGNNLFKH
jgi:hypothetical protein